MAQTLRPKNKCKDCGDTWYPRGRDLSNRCPNCGSGNVVISREGLFAGAVVLAFFGLMGLFGNSNSPEQDRNHLTESVEIAVNPNTQSIADESVESGGEEITQEPTPEQFTQNEGSDPTSTDTAISQDDQPSLSALNQIEFRENFRNWSESEKKLRDKYTALLNDSNASNAELETRRKDYLIFVDNKNKKCGNLESKHSSNINSDVSHVTFNHEEIQILNCHQEANIARLNESEGI